MNTKKIIKYGINNFHTRDSYLELAKKALCLSAEMQDTFKRFVKLLEQEYEIITEMEQNRTIQIENDNFPF